jgi:fluoride ion exporter CrcB/FEX
MRQKKKPPVVYVFTHAPLPPVPAGTHRRQLKFPGEDDLKNWSHHEGVSGIGEADAVLSAIGGDLVSFVFGLEVPGQELGVLNAALQAGIGGGLSTVSTAAVEASLLFSVVGGRWRGYAYLLLTLVCSYAPALAIYGGATRGACSSGITSKTSSTLPRFPTPSSGGQTGSSNGCIPRFRSVRWMRYTSPRLTNCRTGPW